MRKTFFTHLFIWCVVLGFASTALAQNNSLTAVGSNETGQIVIDGFGDLLWDNFQTKGLSGVISNEHGGLPPGANQVLSADDFVIPPGDTWTITEIAATGFYSAGKTEVWGVRFYADDAGGGPGTVLATETVPLTGGDPNPVGTLSIPVVLSEGTYWVSIYGIHTTALDLATFRWNWYTSEDPEILSEPYLIDEAGFFGFLPWTSFSGLGLPDLNSMQFQLFGQVGGGGPSLFFDDFKTGLGNWTITNDGGTCIWEIHDASEYMLGSTGAALNVMAADADDCGSGSTTLTTATAGPFDATGMGIVTLDFDHDWQTINAADEAYVEVSTDGGASWLSVMAWVGVDQRDSHESFDISAMVAGTNFMLRFRTVQPGWDWWWAVDNVGIDAIVPVELVSFAATVNDQDVNLSWNTATELNNQGFDVERAVNGNYEVIGFVDGNGTTTELQYYSFTDKNVAAGQYTYRLKQIDFDGTFEYSDVIEVDVTVPKVFALEQNYPNPFNPSTTIKFSLAADSKVTLTVFDILGQEVANLISGNLAAGSHEINFNASNIPSGVYFYRIDATVVDGTNFTSVKKMILTK